jgi:hypothetical protein
MMVMGNQQLPKEWGILDIPIPPNVLDLNGDGQLTPNELQSALQKMRITVTSPVAGEVIPQGRTPVSYELAGIKLALYDEQGLPRPGRLIWQPVIAQSQQMIRWVHEDPSLSSLRPSSPRTAPSASFRRLTLTRLPIRLGSS